MKIIEIPKNQEVKIKANPDGTQTVEIRDKNAVRLGDLNPGDVFKIEGLEFIVLEQGLFEKTFVISKNLLIESENFGEDNNYERSHIKEIIEAEILPIVELGVGKNNIIENSMYIESVDMKRIGEITCKMRPITFDESRKYNDLLFNNKLPDSYWTLTPWSTRARGDKHSVVVISPYGHISICSRPDFNHGVRPVCILNSNIFVTKK